jgi:hypothetical protein
LTPGPRSAAKPWVNKAEQFTERGAQALPACQCPWSGGYNRVLTAIQLPPLNSPKDGPPHRTQGP